MTQSSRITVYAEDTPTSTPIDVRGCAQLSGTLVVDLSLLNRTSSPSSGNITVREPLHPPITIHIIYLSLGA